MSKDIKLGVTAKDKITGFQGVVTGLCYYISGCHQALLAPTVDDKGAARRGEWFDLQRLDVDPSAALITLENGDAPGCDMAAPIR